MLSQRQKPVFIAIAVVAAIWIAALAGYTIAKNARVTPEKVRAYAESVDFDKLSPAERAAAIEKLARMLNALSLEDRQRLQMDRTAYAWFAKMTEAEKSKFLEATMPTGFKQMIGAFENLPEDKRRRTIDVSLRRLKEAREKMASGDMPQPEGTNQIVLSEDLRQEVTKIGLKTFYSQSSAQTKAELAPLLEEMQKAMQSGMILRGGPRQ